MESKIQKQIIDYFSFFEEFYNTTKTCLKTCQNYAISINTLIRRCKLIQKAKTRGTPLEQFEDLQTRLAATLFVLIQENVLEIQSQQFIVEELFAKLSYKHKLLIESCKYIDFTANTNIIRGTSFQPSLKTLLEFAAETLTFGSQIYAQIDTSLNLLQYQKLNTESLVENFKVTRYWQLRVTEILHYTSFCSENEI